MTLNLSHGPLAKYVKVWVAHAPRMPGTYSPPQRVSDPDIHRGTCVPHVPRYMPGLLTNGFLWSRWQGKRSRHSQRMRNLQFYVSCNWPIQLSQGQWSKQKANEILYYFLPIFTIAITTIMQNDCMQRFDKYTVESRRNNMQIVLVKVCRKQND